MTRASCASLFAMGHADSIADVIASLQVIRSAVDAGELDRRIDAVMGQVKAGLAKQAAPSARSTLKLPSKLT